ncbi:uncharacterized protein [Amphiura filiformis]|uniref:uncharacterized protein n=1 Tax=Amphiura filiformis TaxID=82378 RepID=UPI003B227F2A
MSVAASVVYEVHASTTKELSDLFWNEVGSVSLQNLVLLWLQLTQSIAEKLRRNSISEKEKDAVLQFLIKLDVVKQGRSTSNQQEQEDSATKRAETTTTDNAEADVTSTSAEVPQAAAEQRENTGRNTKQGTQECPEKADVKQEAVDGNLIEEKQREDDGGTDGDEDDDDDVDYDPADDVDSEDGDNNLVNSEDSASILKAIGESLKETQVDTVQTLHSDVDDNRQLHVENEDIERQSKNINNHATTSLSVRKRNHKAGTTCTCHICRQTFDDPSLTRQHIKESHDIYRKHVCTLCGKRFLRPYLLRSHTQACIQRIRRQKQRKVSERIHVSSDESVVNNKANEASSSSVNDAPNTRPNTRQKARRESQSQKEVSSVTGSNDQIDDTANSQHTETEGGDDCLPDEDVDENSLEETDLSTENKHFDDDIGLVCQICKETFDDPSTTEQHIKETHDIYKKHVCTYCGSKFMKPSYLQIHVKRKHVGSSRKKCTVCFRTFCSKNFSEHDCRPKETFECGLCHKQCLSEKTLEKHVQEIHEKAKSYKCSVCDKGFIRQTDLQRHAKIHDSSKASEDPKGRTINQCDKCLKIYKILPPSRIIGVVNLLLNSGASCADRGVKQKKLLRDMTTNCTRKSRLIFVASVELVLFKSLI